MTCSTLSGSSRSSLLTGVTTRSRSPPSADSSCLAYGSCSRARRSACAGGGSGGAVEPPMPATASTLPVDENSVRLEDAGLLGGAIEARREASRRRFAQRDRDLARLVARLLEQVVERVAAEIEAALERAVDADVEPALDALAEELHRHRVDERAGQHGDQREEQHEPHREPRAEDAGLQVAREPPQLIADEQHQQRRQRRVEHEQEVVAAREELGVRRRGCEQEQRDRGEAGQHEQQPAHSARGQEAAHGVKLQRYHSDCSDHSREASAFTWNGFGS